MDDKVTMPVAKAATAIGVAGTAQFTDTVGTVAGPHIALFDLTWPNIASAAAAIYTTCLILEFVWKKWLRPFGEARGWWKPKPLRKMTPEQIRELIERHSDDTDYK